MRNQRSGAAEWETIEPLEIGSIAEERNRSEPSWSYACFRQVRSNRCRQSFGSNRGCGLRRRQGSSAHGCRRLIRYEPDPSDFVHAEIAVWTVREHLLAGDGLELLAVERDVHLIGFERDQVRD